MPCTACCVHVPGCSLHAEQPGWPLWAQRQARMLRRCSNVQEHPTLRGRVELCAIRSDPDLYHWLGKLKHGQGGQGCGSGHQCPAAEGGDVVVTAGAGASHGSLPPTTSSSRIPWRYERALAPQQLAERSPQISSRTLPPSVPLWVWGWCTVSWRLRNVFSSNLCCKQMFSLSVCYMGFVESLEFEAVY